MSYINENTIWKFPFCPQVHEALDWEGITKTYDWVSNMQGVPQDPIYHAEGDVFVHTRMVLEALMDLEAWQHLSDLGRNITFLACLLHDVAKPICTQIEDNGSITSPKHAKIGAMLARQLMYAEPHLFGDISFEVRELVCQLVRYHGLPLWFHEKENIAKTLIQASLHTPMDWLALVAEADVRGRICADQTKLLERVDFFRMYCYELDCYETPKIFPDNHTRFMYFQRGDIALDYPFFDETTFEVLLLSGLPGVGKDTFIQQNYPNWKVISLDDIRKELGITPTDNQGQVIQLGQERAKELLRKKTPFIWNATNLQKERRGKLIDLFATYKARTEIVYLEVPLQQLLIQNTQRAAVVPENVLMSMIKKWEVPTLDEAQNVVYTL